MNRYWVLLLGFTVFLSATPSLVVTDILALRELKMGMERTKAATIINNMSGVDQEG